MLTTRRAARQLLPEHRQHLRLGRARDRDPGRPQRRARGVRRVARQRARHRRQRRPCSAAEERADRRRARRARSTASGGSFSGGGTVQAINGQIATNVVLAKAHASITDSLARDAGGVARRGPQQRRRSTPRCSHRDQLERRPRRQHRARLQHDRLAVAELPLQHRSTRPRRPADRRGARRERAGRAFAWISNTDVTAGGDLLDRGPRRGADQRDGLERRRLRRPRRSTGPRAWRSAGSSPRTRSRSAVHAWFEDGAATSAARSTSSPSTRPGSSRT